MKIVKDQLRARMKSLRQSILGNREKAGQDAAHLFIETFTFPPETLFSAYWAMNTEIPTLPLLNALIGKGYTCSLPRTQGAMKPLTFIRWTPDTEMITGDHNIPIPKGGERVEPDILIIPLLAFTRNGHRLGFGKGHYDYTLQKLRRKKPILAIGYAYAKQEVDSIPQDQYDQKLDAVVTNQDVIRITI